MYQIENRSEAIRLIQKYLSFIYPDKDVAQNGIYDNNTQGLIREFQTESDIESNGSIDYATYTRLYEEYKRNVMIRRIRNESSHLYDFPISYGSFGDGIGRINSLLLSVASRFGIQTDLRRGRYFSKESSALTEDIRAIFKIKKADYVDEELYDRLITEEKAAQKFEQTSR